MKKILFILLLLNIATIKAQSIDSLFAEANILYKKNQFTKAITTYKLIEEKGFISSNLYYNIGNSYYKLNKVGPSIFYYEKALQLNPDNEDVKNNMVFAKRLALDNIEPLPKTLWQKINKNYIQLLSYNDWAMLVVVLSFLAAFLFLLFYFNNNSNKKRLFFVLSMMSFIFLSLALTITYYQYNNIKNTRSAIVFASESIVRNAPTLNSEKNFTLHEGTKVEVLDIVDNWKKIKIEDGKLGWIIASEIKEF